MTKMPEHIQYVPFFEIDPNTPGRMVNGRLCIYTGIRSKDMVDDLRNGVIKIGDFAVGYTPHESYDEVTKTFGPESDNDAGLGFPCRIIDWHEVEPSNSIHLRALVYLELDGAYAIVDRRESVSNDEGTYDGNDRARQGRVSGLEESAGESGRPDGSSVAM